MASAHWSPRLRLLSAAIHLVPLNALEEGGEVPARIGSVVHRARVLVHVHHEEWRAPGQAVGVIPEPAGSGSAASRHLCSYSRDASGAAARTARAASRDRTAAA